MQKAIRTQSGSIQIMACLAITGAIELIPTAGMEVLLNLTALDLLNMAEARMVLYRLHILKQPAVPRTVSGLAFIRKNVVDPLLDVWSGYTTPSYYHSKIFNAIIDRDYWRNKDPVFPEQALIWFTDGSRANSGTGSGIFGIRPNRSFSFLLGKFSTVFQTEIHVILQCEFENISEVYNHKNILIFSDSQAAFKELSSPKVTSGLVAECLDSRSALASLKDVTLVWVPGHCGIPGNEVELISLLDKHQICRYFVQSRL